MFYCDKYKEDSMKSDISWLMELKSYCLECIDKYDRVKLFDVSKRFRYISDMLEEIIREKELEIFAEGEPIPKGSIPND